MWAQLFESVDNNVNPAEELEYSIETKTYRESSISP